MFIFHPHGAGLRFVQDVFELDEPCAVEFLDLCKPTPHLFITICQVSLPNYIELIYKPILLCFVSANYSFGY